MSLASWIRNWKRSVERRWVLSQSIRRKNASRRRANRPRLEVLEGRWLLSTYIVTSTADSGAGSLRDAINSANATGSTITEIDFNIGTKGTSSGMQTISPATQLPWLTASGVFINGSSEIQWQGVTSTSPLIELNGPGAGSGAAGLLLGGDHDSVSGLFITNFTEGIQGGDCTIGGTAAGAGNVISGNGSGVETTGLALVVGNYFGTNAAGTAALPNRYGIEDSGPGDTIGGTVLGARNVISGNTIAGELINNSVEGTIKGDTIQGNYIGLNYNGSTAIANGNGVEIDGADVTIGGTAAGAGNVISGNSQNGVLIGGADDNASGTVVQGNLIGTDATGTKAIGNSVGVTVSYGGNINQSQGVTIGGSVAGAANVISGNSGDGVQIATGVSGVVVLGNYIGTDVSGGAALGNSGNGVQISGASNNTIGGGVASAGNLIADNSQGGVLVNAGTGDTIRLNSIFANGSTGTGPGITLSNNGNNNLAAPSLLTATLVGNTLTVTGTFTTATTNVSYALDFYANSSTDPEGKVYLGSLTETPTSTGRQSFTYTTTTTVTGTYPLITATLTDNSGDTSPFSNGVTSAAPYVVTSTADDGIVGTLRDAINQVNAGKYHEIDFKIGTSGSAQTINLTSQLPALTANGVFINGLSQGGSGNTTQLITLDGAKVGSSSDGLLLQGSGCLVSGLILSHFDNGIEVDGANNIIGGTTTGAGNIISGNTKDGLLIDSNISGVVVQGNYIGTDVAGSAALANSIGVEVAGSNNTLGGTTSSGGNIISRGAGNVISGNSSDGVLIDSAASGVTVQGNYIGTDQTGTTAIANGTGILVSSSQNTIGGGGGEGNVISGNTGDGVQIASGISGVLLVGNDIGTDHTGTTAVANGTGVEVSGSDNTVGTDNAGSGYWLNIISGNTGDGVLIDSGVSGVVVQGNYIGINAGGGALGNSIGVEVAGSSNTVGSLTGGPGAGNGISGNRGVGVLLDSTGAGNVISSNYVGIGIFSNDVRPNSIGVEVAGNNNTIGGASGSGNVISGNTGDGVKILSAASGNQVLGNTIGVNVYDNGVVGNSGDGIEVAGSNNTLGASWAVAYNEISGNSGDGVKLDSGSSGNVVLGSYIGTDHTGTKAIANGTGVEVSGSNNTIGGSSYSARNILSGNIGDGVLLDSGSSGNEVLGNTIGANYAGTVTVANKVGIEDSGSSNMIGGSVLGARNLISGNSSDGVLIDSAATKETMQGNYIGTDFSGNTALANGTNGVELKGSGNSIGGNSGSNYYVRNFLSGNTGDGLLIANGATGNQVLGNFIGLGVSGTHGAGNSIGIEIAGNSNTIGGTNALGTNYISGNNNDGILLDSTASANLIQGTDVGTDYAGRAAVANGGSGIEVMGNGNTLGSTTTAARNIISGNSGDGVKIDSGVSGTLIQGNFIGLNAIDAAVPNAGNGVNIAGTNNTVGGTATGARNYISGNSGDGVLLDSTASGNVVLGNFIGVNLFSSAAANHNGIEVAGTQNTVGGSASGAYNVISGNTNDGVLLDSTASGNAVLGNNVGQNVYGTVAVGNSIGIEVAGSNNTVGASWAVAPNVLSGNGKDGVLLDSTASGNQVLGNYIGSNHAGAVALANQVGIEDAGNHNTIGGSVLGDRNLISGNTGDGVLLDSTAAGETLQGNYVGLDYSGKTVLANGKNGVEVQGNNNTIGGNSGSNYFTRNFLSGNTGDGLLIANGATGNVVQGNFIGIDVSGTKGAGNSIGIEVAGNSNTLGGSVAGAGNTIAYNGGDGVLVSAGVGNVITSNSIFANTALGIALSNGGNNNLAAPSLLSASYSGGVLTVSGNFTAPTANVSYVIQFFANPTGDPEGKVYLGSLTVTPTSTGTQSFSFRTATSAVLSNPIVTATLTDSGDGTSEFSLGISA